MSKSFIIYQPSTGKIRRFQSGWKGEIDVESLLSSDYPGDDDVALLLVDADPVNLNNYEVIDGALTEKIVE